MFDIRGKMYNRRASGRKSMPDALIRSLGPVRGQTIADIGAGGGYFSLRFAGIVGNGGRVYAVDVDQKLLDYVRCQGEALGLSNLRAVTANEFFSSVAPSSINLVFMRNVYHHLDNPVRYFTEMRKYLKPEGRVAIIDYRSDTRGFSFYKLFKHSVSSNEVMKDMAKAGYALETSHAYLPEQYFMVFKSMDRLESR